MTSTERMWLHGMAAQRNLLHLMSYGSAFVGTAALQTVHLGMTAPRSFWSAMARAASGPVDGPRPAADVIPFSAAAPASGPVLDRPDAVLPHRPDQSSGGTADDLTALKGVGATLAQALNGCGIFRFDQIAALDEDAIARIDARQKGFRMTCARHDLVGQARARL